MPRRSLLAALALLAACTPLPAADAPGAITGTVRFTGPVPPPKLIETTDGATIRHRDLVVDPKTRGLRDVVIVLEGAPARPKADGLKPVVVDQREMVFGPRVVAVRHGQAVQFTNSDGCNHSVMASSLAKANNFNVFVTGDKPYEHVFEPHRHPVTIGCSLHPWMRAWVYVVPHPWFTLSGEKGTFKIPAVPPSKYVLWLRHADTGLHERRPVEVLPGKTLDVAVEWKKVGE